MSETTDTSFPRRDAAGRLAQIGDLLGVSLAAVVVGLAAVLVFDVGFGLLGSGGFGSSNGWLAAVMPAWVFVEEFRAAQYGAVRVVVALVATAVAGAAGLLAAGLAVELAPLVRGGLGAAVLTLGYALIWFYGMRALTGRGAASGE